MTVLLATTASVPLEGAATPAPETRPARKPKPVADTVPLPVPMETLNPAEEPARPAAASAKKTAPPAPTPAVLKKSKPVQAPTPKPAELPPAREEEEVPAEAKAMAETGPLPPVGTAPPRRHIAKQEELHFESATRGRFEKTHETMYRGENLDQPTFRRRGITIKI
jgi:hypothetical protein